MTGNFLRRTEDKSKINHQLEIYHDSRCHTQLAIIGLPKHTGFIGYHNKAEQIGRKLHDIQHDGIL